MNLENILNLDIKNLKREQYRALKKHTINRLEEIINYLKVDDLEGVLNMMKYSPSGDEMGCDNYFINFSFKEDYDENPMDLMDIIDLMKNL